MKWGDKEQLIDLRCFSILQEIEQYTLSQQILEPRIAGEEDEEGMGMGEKGGQNGSAGGVGNRVITVDLGADANADADKGTNFLNMKHTSLVCFGAIFENYFII